MRRVWDYEHIDNARWPGRGPVYSFLEFNRHKANGICQFIKDASGDRILRSRAYEITDACKLTELMISDVEVLRVHAQWTLRVTQPFWLLDIAYGRMLGLKPTQVIFPVRLYSERVERRAARSYWRQMTRDEVYELTSRATQKAMQVISTQRGHSARGGTGIYCFDQTKEAQVDEEISRIGELIDVEISEKVRALLEKSNPNLSEAPSQLRVEP